jgi:hypothetical protein
VGTAALAAGGNSLVLTVEFALRKAAHCALAGNVGVGWANFGGGSQPAGHLRSVTQNYWNSWNSHHYSKIATGSTGLCWRSVRLLLLASFGLWKSIFIYGSAELEFCLVLRFR